MASTCIVIPWLVLLSSIGTSLSASAGDTECAADDFTVTGIAYMDGVLRVQVCMGDNWDTDNAPRIEAYWTDTHYLPEQPPQNTPYLKKLLEEKGEDFHV